VNVSATSFTNTIQSTPTPSPSSSSIPYNNSFTGSATYNSFDQYLLCPISKKLVDCSSGEIFYVTGSLEGFEIGAVISVFINNISYCVTFVDVINTAPSHTLNSIESGDLLNCVFCTPGTSPSPTPSITPTLTPSMTQTPTPSAALQTFIYRVCRQFPLNNLIVAQTVQVPGVLVGQNFLADSSGNASGYIVDFTEIVLGNVSNYPADIFYNGNYFGTPTNIQNGFNCDLS